ncbi:GNAT family N-acetyltransferase [Chengkuizengella sp. SCS-71B]|uniref:GNAT family N-acetyltransferase n=1 Tax=Chengkuizengella sp. SCS-71B TaxID=3115290 RepID=UPI0032C24784
MIETNRLILREFNEKDLDKLYILMRNNGFIYNFPDKSYLLRYIQNLKKKGNHFRPDDTRFVLGIFLKDKPKLVGWSAVLPSRRLTSEQRERKVVIANDHRKKGYATESGKAILEYMFNKTNHDEIIIRVSRSSFYYKPIAKSIIKKGYEPITSKNSNKRSKYAYFMLTKENFMNNREKF